jgi:hypothetical protein
MEEEELQLGEYVSNEEFVAKVQYYARLEREKEDHLEDLVPDVLRYFETRRAFESKASKQFFFMQFLKTLKPLEKEYVLQYEDF